MMDTFTGMTGNKIIGIRTFYVSVVACSFFRKAAFLYLVKSDCLKPYHTILSDYQFD
jgi:hypothetical protein